MSGVPGDPRHFFLGHLNQLGGLTGPQRLTWGLNQMKKYKDIYSLWVGPTMPQVVVCSGTSAKVILENSHPKGKNQFLSILTSLKERLMSFCILG